MKDTAGNEIIPPFLYPCPNKCNSTGGCDSCRTYRKMTPPPITTAFAWFVWEIGYKGKPTIEWI